MNGFSAFVTLQKVDVAKREVWGVAAVEMPDRAGEIMDYDLSKKNFVAWSQQMEKATNGKSKGNVRGMHADIAAGKVIHFEPNDEKKLFYIGTKIVDDNEWKKVLEGVYTGFSVGGSYGKKWADPAQFGLTRYEAKPVEISLVDVPCIPGAQFEVIKADGAKEMRKFVTVADAADLAKGDKDGHPFRGNQWTNGTRVAAGGQKGKVVESYGETVVVELDGRGGDTRKFDQSEVQDIADLPQYDAESVKDKFGEWITENGGPDVSPDRGMEAMDWVAGKIGMKDGDEFPEEWNEWFDESLGQVKAEFGEEEDFYLDQTGDPDLAAMQRISDRDIVEEQILKPRSDRAEAAAAFEVFDPDEFTDYEKNLVNIHKTATRKGILPIQDSKARQALSREAAAIINETRSSGYTVYDSDLSAFNGTAEDLGSFAGVGYGSGESAGKVRQMVGILNERGYKAMPTKEGVIVVYHPNFSKAAGSADLAKGDEPGHPFRGNQYTDAAGAGGTGESKRKTAREQRKELFEETDQDGKRVKVTDRATGESSDMTVREARNKLFDIDAQDDESPFDISAADNEEFPDRVTEAAGTEAEFNAREEEKKRRLQDDRVKRLKAANEKRAAAREKFVNSKPAPATGSAQEKAMGMTEAEFNALDEMGYVKPWGVSEEGMSELKSMRRDQSQANRFVEVDPGVKVPQKSAAPVHAPTVKKFPGWRKIESDFGDNQGQAYIAHDTWRAVEKGKDPTKAFIDAVENENFYGSQPDIVKERKKVQRYLESKGIVFDAKRLSRYEDAQKAAGPGDLIKLLAEANMNADELIKKLQGSSDPAMMGLATQLSKAFPPPKKKAPGEGKDEPAPEGDGGDKPAAKGKGNPFAKEKDGAEEEAVPGEETAPGEEDDSEMESGDIPEDEIDPKTGEPVEQAGQMSPEQAEAVKMVVISLLEELGLVQRQESAPGTGGMQLSVSVTGLAKAMGVQGLSKRFDTVLGDVGKLATAVDDLEKRLGVMPVLREMGGSQNPLLEQQAELLKGMLNSSNDPSFQQAIRNELATLEIKKIQSAKE